MIKGTLQGFINKKKSKFNIFITFYQKYTWIYFSSVFRLFPMLWIPVNSRHEQSADQLVFQQIGYYLLIVGKLHSGLNINYFIVLHTFFKRGPYWPREH